MVLLLFLTVSCVATKPALKTPVETKPSVREHFEKIRVGFGFGGQFVRLFREGYRAVGPVVAEDRAYEAEVWILPSNHWEWSALIRECPECETSQYSIGRLRFDASAEPVELAFDYNWPRDDYKGKWDAYDREEIRSFIGKLSPDRIEGAVRNAYSPYLHCCDTMEEGTLPRAPMLELLYSSLYVLPETEQIFGIELRFLSSNSHQAVFQFSDGSPSPLFLVKADTAGSTVSFDFSWRGNSYVLEGIREKDQMLGTLTNRTDGRRINFQAMRTTSFWSLSAKEMLDRRPLNSKLRDEDALRASELLSAKPEMIFIQSAGLWVDRTEVTVEAYRNCVESGKCSPPDTGAFDEVNNWRTPGRDQHPINGVTLDQAVQFCAANGKRVPTEKEWEKAASGGMDQPYPWGREWPSCKLANTGLCWEGPCYGPMLPDCADDSEPGCARPAGNSPDGLCDMGGNLGEWVIGSDMNVGIVKGGTWQDEPRQLTITESQSGDPTQGYEAVGFRCVRDVKAEK